MVLILYHEDIYHEFTLEGEDHVDHNLILDPVKYRLTAPVQLRLEVMDHRWRLRQGPNWHAAGTGGNRQDIPLEDGKVVGIVTSGGDRLTLVAVDRGDVLPVSRKFDLSGLGTLSFGSGVDNGICYSFQNLVSRHHGALERRRDGMYLVDRSTNGIYCNGKKVKGSCRLQFGDQIQIFGLMLVYLGSVLCLLDRTGALTLSREVQNREVQDTSGRVQNRQETPRPAETVVNRAPRVLPELYHDKVTIEEPPDQQEVKKKSMLLTVGPSLTMALPMVLGTLLMVYGMRSSGSSSSAFMFTGLIVAVGSAILGALWAILNIRQQKREDYDTERSRVDRYSNYLMCQGEEVRRRYQHNTAAMAQTYPSPSVLCGYGPGTPQLWSRDASHPDFLFVRLGLGDVPFQVEIEVPKKRFALHEDLMQGKPELLREQYAVLRQVPVGVDLREETLVGVVGGPGKEGAVPVVYSILAGLAATVSYTDVKIVMVCANQSRESLARWDFVRWLPHLWNENRTLRCFSVGRSEAGEVFYDLTNVLRSRTGDEQSPAGTGDLRPYYVLVVEDVSLLEGELIAKYCYEKGRNLGLSTILLAEREVDLPNSCECIIRSDGQSAGIAHPLRGITQTVRFDTPRRPELEHLAITLSGLRVREVESSTEIPDQVDFLSMYGVSTLEELHVLDRWYKNRTYRSMSVPIGIKAGGGLCNLDIHEKFHGPHGLIAGTTGSGKSETLQTYILSLAVNFSPQDVGFFLIDFKGGGMANLFQNLPHTLGTVSNLSGNQVRRAMISIKSENRRRQRIFNEYDINNINQYTQLVKSGQADQPLPHLFIIIDEFAELKREEPDFMRELISVAQVGRSLGVHLLLSTQKPSGTVDDNIWSNTKFRLCLRVQTRQDSNDMLHKPDAAFITQAGRCYLQVGSDEIYEQFQSAWSGAPYYGAAGAKSEAAATLLTHTGQPSDLARARRREQSDAPGDITQLDALVAYLAQLAGQESMTAGTALWLPVLPAVLDLKRLEHWQDAAYDGAWHTPAGEWSLSTLTGLTDDPGNQTQLPLAVDFAANGHLAVLAGVFSGKSTFLQTLVYGLIMHYDPDHLNLYLLDFSANMLSCFAQAPQVGAVLDEGDLDYVGNFFHMLDLLLEERKRLFTGGNYSQYVRAHGVTLPAVVVVIDNYPAFAEKTEDKYDAIMMRCAREGVSYGVFLVCSAGEFGMNGIPNRIGENITTAVCLNLGDKFKYMDLLHTTSIDVLPEAGIPGRGLAKREGTVLEFQTAVAYASEDDYARGRAIARDCERMAKSWKGAPARGVPRIPDNPTLSLFRQEPGYQALCRDPAALPLGYCKEDATLYALDLTRTYCAVVAGRDHTGRYNTLKLLMSLTGDKGAQIVVFEKGADRLRGLTAQLGGTYLETDDQLYQFWSDFLPEFVSRNKRKRALVDEGAGDEEIFREMCALPMVCFFIADLNEFFRSVYHPEEGVGEMKGFMENILQKGALHNIYFFARMQVEDHTALGGWAGYRFFTAAHSGLLLGGNPGGQRVFNFQNIPYNQLSRTLPKGTALVTDPLDDTQARTIVVPQGER